MENIQYSGCKKRFKKKKKSVYVPETQESSPIYNGTNWINPPRESTESELNEAANCGWKGGKERP